MVKLLSFIVLLFIAYGGSRLQRKKTRTGLAYLHASGFIYGVVGILLGPMGSGVLSDSMMDELLPVVIFSLGWVGFLVGMQADFSLLRKVPKRYLGFTFFESGSTVVAVTLLSYVLFHLMGITGALGWLLALLAGTCAGVSSQALPAMRNTDSSSKTNAVFLKVVTGLDDYPAMAVVIVLFAFLEHDVHGYSIPMGLFWIGMTIGLGLAIGLLLDLLLRPKSRFDETMAVCLGVIAISAGAAAYLRLAVAGLGFVTGLYIANSPVVKKQTFYNVLTAAERPIVYFMFLLAGASLRFNHLSWMWPLVVFVVVRTLVKLAAGNVVAYRMVSDVTRDGALGWGLIAPGPLSVAVALDYRFVQQGPYADLILWTVMGGVMVSEMLIPITFRRISVRVGEDSVS